MYLRIKLLQNMTKASGEAQMGHEDAHRVQRPVLSRQTLTPPPLPAAAAAAVAEAAQLQRQRQPLQAAAAYRQALGHCPGDMRLHTNLGDCLWLADRPWEALGPLLEAIRLAPGQALPHRTLAHVLRDLNRFEQAEAYYLKAWQLEADPTTAWGLSQTLIGLERYAEAYQWSENRFAMAEASCYRPLPHWPGPEAAGPGPGTPAPLHIWSEQGFGDTLQYLRWLQPLCRQPGLRLLEVEPPLVSLLQEGLSWLEHPPQVQAKQDSPTPVPGASVSLLSLPHLLGGAPLEPQALAASAAYLRLGSKPGDGGPDRPQEWPPQGRQPRVGLTWAAGRKADDGFTWREFLKRSLPTEQLLALASGLQARGAELHNLQFCADTELQDQPWASRLAPGSDFLVQARQMANLDLVISVDTATAHLAGAMGLPCWLLLPFSADPRWLRQRPDSVWYPTMKLFRQPSSGDWPRVVDALLISFERHTAQLNWLDP
jgi:tetratricopeptide (TPR) repeat protein